MPIDRKLYEEMQRKRDAEHRAAESERRRALAGTVVMCLVWAALGLVCFGFALHAADPGMGEIFRWGAYVITYGGLSFTLLRAYKKGEDRGDW